MVKRTHLSHQTYERYHRISYIIKTNIMFTSRTINIPSMRFIFLTLSIGLYCFQATKVYCYPLSRWKIMGSVAWVAVDKAPGYPRAQVSRCPESEGTILASTKRLVTQILESLILSVIGQYRKKNLKSRATVFQIWPGLSRLLTGPSVTDAASVSEDLFYKF